MSIFVRSLALLLLKNNNVVVNCKSSLCCHSFQYNYLEDLFPHVWRQGQSRMKNMWRIWYRLHKSRVFHVANVYSVFNSYAEIVVKLEQKLSCVTRLGISFHRGIKGSTIYLFTNTKSSSVQFKEERKRT